MGYRSEIDGMRQLQQMIVLELKEICQMVKDNRGDFRDLFAEHQKLVEEIWQLERDIARAQPWWRVLIGVEY